MGSAGETRAAEPDQEMESVDPSNASEYWNGSAVSSDGDVGEVTDEPESARLTGLRSMVEQLIATDLHDLSVNELKSEMVGLRRVIDQLEARFVHTVRAFDARKGFRAGKHPSISMVSWLKEHCRMTGFDASGRVHVGRQLEKLEATDEAFSAGDIGFSHARVITKLLDDVGEKPTLQAESTLLEAAEKMEAGKLNTITTKIKYYFNPDGALEEDNKKYERRRLHISETFEGLTVLDGLFDAEAGAVIKAAINALVGPPSKDEVRTPKQRRADALAEICRRQLDGGDLPETGGQRPHLIITVDAATLAGPADGAGLTDGEVLEARSVDAEIVENAVNLQPIFGSAELGPSGHIIHGETARRLSCDAMVSRIVLDAKSQPLDVGRTTRLISSGIRKALNFRDKGCRFPGCDLPPDWCDGHHIIPWFIGGPTKLDNLVLLCRRHHRFVHERQQPMVIEGSLATEELCLLSSGEPP